jgi:hypothetical protein
MLLGQLINFSSKTFTDNKQIKKKIGHFILTHDKYKMPRALLTDPNHLLVLTATTSYTSTTTDCPKT